jgi:hypothetical protein
MKLFQRLALLALFVAGSTAAFAQHGPGNGGPGDPRDTSHHRDTLHRPPMRPPCNIFTDSCFRILLSKLSADDAAALQAAMDAKSSLMTQLNQLRADIRAAMKSGDSALARSLWQQLKPLMERLRTADKTIRDILRRNDAAVRETMKDCCPMRLAICITRTAYPSDPSGEIGLRCRHARPSGATSVAFEYDLKAPLPIRNHRQVTSLAHWALDIDLGKPMQDISSTHLMYQGWLAVTSYACKPISP